MFDQKSDHFLHEKRSTELVNWFGHRLKTWGSIKTRKKAAAEEEVRYRDCRP
ncbi:MAG: hypothetical protein H6642_17250 [Caldilineaceae bacterium]|nr:hypothetical protein [Caldilineaceae bacterium]